MNKKLKIIIPIAFAAVILGLYFLYQQIMYVTTDNAQVDAHAVMLAPKVGGYIKSVMVKEGEKVKAGSVLIEIDNRDYENQVNQSEGELYSLEAKLKDLEKNYHRTSELFSKDAVSRSQFDQALANYNEVKFRYQALSAQVNQAKLNLENTKILAPVDGIIAKKSVEVGQLAAPGVPLLGFVDANNRWITANFKETEIGDIKVGAFVTATVDAISSRTFRGKVLSINPSTGSTFTLLPPDNSTGNFTKVVQRVPVKIELENLSSEDIENMRAGLSAYVKVSKH